MANELVRAKCEATGAVAALPSEALEHGMVPGWKPADGPVPSEPKPATFPEQYGSTADGEAPPEETTDEGGEQPPEETPKAARSARKNRS